MSRKLYIIDCIAQHCTVYPVVFHCNVFCMAPDQSEISIIHTDQCYCYCCWHLHVDTLSARKEGERETEKERELWQLCCTWKKKKKTLLDVESAQHKELANYFWNGRGVLEMWKCFPGYIPQTANKWQAHKQDVRVMTFSPSFSPHTHTHAMDRIVFLISKLLTQKLWPFSKSIQRVCA